MASGSEVHLLLEAAQMIAAEGTAMRVVSMPSWELFDAQPEEYRRRILPPAVMAKIAVETGSPQGWHRYVGDFGHIIALDHFGASAPYKILYEKFRLTAEHIVERVHEII